MSLLVLASQPLAALASQLPKPVLHAPRPHALARHRGAALATAGHARPHMPQLATSDAVSTQPDAHIMFGAAHTAVHTPATQD